MHSRQHLPSGPASEISLQQKCVLVWLDTRKNITISQWTTVSPPRSQKSSYELLSPVTCSWGWGMKGAGPRAAVAQWTVNGGSPILAPQATSRVSSYTVFLRLFLPALQQPVAWGWMCRRGTSGPAKLPKPWVVCFHFADLSVPDRLTVVPTGLGHEEGGRGLQGGVQSSRWAQARHFPTGHLAPWPITSPMGLISLGDSQSSPFSCFCRIFGLHGERESHPFVWVSILLRNLLLFAWNGTILAEFQVSIDTYGKIRLNDLPLKHVCVPNRIDSAFYSEVPGGTLGDCWLCVSTVQALVPRSWSNMSLDVAVRSFCRQD